MCAWFSRVRAPKPSTDESERLQLPGGLWTKCPKCDAITYTKELERNLNVCPKCEHHFRMTAEARIRLLADRQSFEEIDADLRSDDPLGFKDSLRYKERLKKAERAGIANESVRAGRARINGRSVMLGVFEFFFMGGSMGVVAGEKLTRLMELGAEEYKPVIVVSASGGARMQEGIYSLMQMAKTSAALVRLSEKKLPYISVLTDPTTGGVAASFAMLGDLIVAEPGALIGFAGPRVIEQTIKKKLPEGFQRSEFLVEHGMVDTIVHRAQLKDMLANMLSMLGPN